MTRSSPDIVDELYGLADSLMQGSGKTVVISYANIRFAADEIKRLRASLQPATPTSCPYKGPFGCKCEPGECKYRAGGDAVAGEAKTVAGCICQDQHRRGYCTEPGCSHAVAATPPEGWRLVPAEPTTAQHIAAMEFALAHMKAHGVTSLSPFKDYPPLRETTAGMYRAMVGAVCGDAAQTSLTRKVIEKTLCCPKGCARSDDCFVDGPPTRWSRSKHEREQADAFVALLSLPSTNRGGK
jgi:hypothetical protein